MKKLNLKNIKNWQRLSTYIMVGLSAVFLLVVLSQVGVAGFVQKGAETALAIGQTCPSPRDYPQCGGTCNGVTYPGNHTVQVHQDYDSACNAVYTCQDLGQIAGQCGNTQPQPSSCSQQPRQYPQCGGTCNGVTFDSSHTIMVNQNVDSSCNVSFQCQDLGQIAGQCGNGSGGSNVTTCKGESLTEDQLESALHGAGYPGPYGAQFQAQELAAYNNAACPAGGNVTTCKGQTISEADLESQLHGAGYPGPYGAQFQAQELAAYNNAACPAVTATPTPTVTVTPTPTVTVTPTPTPTVTVTPTPTVTITPTPTVTVTPTPGTGGTMQCPPGSVMVNGNGNMLVCQSQNQTNNQSVNNTNNNIITLAAAPAAQPRVVTVAGASGVKQLPNTGLPAVGWFLTGLLPLGAKMRKFGNKGFKDDIFSAQDVWEERQYKNTFKD